VSHKEVEPIALIKIQKGPEQSYDNSRYRCPIVVRGEDVG